MTYTWTAAHIFYSGSINLLITECVAPFVQQYAMLLDNEAPFFFIRYPEGGDHVRLRMNTTCPEDTMRHLHACASRFFHAHPAPAAKRRHDWLQDESVYRMPYEPEVIRYGNDYTLQWAERHFVVSSKVVMEWLCNTRNKPASMQVQAIQQHMLLLKSTGRPPEELLMICDYFVEDWLKVFYPGMKNAEEKERWLSAFKTTYDRQPQLAPAVADFWYSAEEESISPSLQYYLSENKKIMDAYDGSRLTFQQLTVAIASMMHMTHNRLGIENPEEAYIMYCTRACLAYIFSQHRLFL
ncbi:MAG TPA: thiopeptide-type bacteriocin biosynthesis protein [Chitinophaga sp.]|uniref:thiopeptide-type bacteriocin biosynthesis protein n=1 Tax=Chitinophaga sp. TaxID=1869181 RepID=UPI002BCBD32C|nr:thiopeptide-type bacteriocin biosynthesis protein [Chitinophaga sp.]HVI48737.1 thiopeptide-type bacteriocin biosynthesis protein [Chitinophaga sp.]